MISQSYVITKTNGLSLTTAVMSYNDNTIQIQLLVCKQISWTTTNSETTIRLNQRRITCGGGWVFDLSTVDVQKKEEGKNQQICL